MLRLATESRGSVARSLWYLSELIIEFVALSRKNREFLNGGFLGEMGGNERAADIYSNSL